VDTSTDDGAALPNRPERDGHQFSGWSEDDRGVERDRWLLDARPSPYGAKRPGERLSRGVTRAREGIHVIPPKAGDLGDDVRGRPEAIHPYPSAWSRHPTGAVSNQPSAPQRRSVRMVQLVMVVFIVFGVIGVGLHYDGNAEFERELHPEDAGVIFLRHVVAGATPVLAPGSMVLLGLIGIAHTYRHPAAAAADRKETLS